MRAVSGSSDAKPPALRYFRSGMLAADFGVNAYFRRGYVNIRRRLRLDNSRATVRLVGRRQSPDVQLCARVCWRADSVSYRSKA